MLARLTIAISFTVALIAPAALAGACHPTTSNPRVCFVGGVPNPCASGDIGGRYYATEDGCTLINLDPRGPQCIWSFWIYEEANGIPGLQRQDEVHDDTCHGAIAPDRIVF